MQSPVKTFWYSVMLIAVIFLIFSGCAGTPAKMPEPAETPEKEEKFTITSPYDEESILLPGRA